MSRILDHLVTQQEAMVQMLHDLVVLESPSDDRRAVNRVAEYLAAAFERLGARSQRLAQIAFGDHLRVDHGLGGTAYGYLLTLGSRRLAYVSDMLRATAEVRQALKDLDMLILGASHYYEGIETWKRSVMDVIAAQELIREVAPARAILTHLSHSVDYDEVTSRLSPPATLAYDGLVVEVQE